MAWCQSGSKLLTETASYMRHKREMSWCAIYRHHMVTNTQTFRILIITDAGAQLKTFWNVFDGIDEFRWYRRVSTHWLRRYAAAILNLLITLTPYMVLPLFPTRFAAHAGGTRVSFIQLLRLFWFDIKCSAWEISYRLIWKKFVNMLSVYAQSEKHRRFNWLIIAILT